MPIFRVEIESTMIVEAESDTEAERLATGYSAISANSDSFHASSCCQIYKTGQLDDGWDAECLPFNGDGQTRLKDILESGDI